MLSLSLVLAVLAMAALSLDRPVRIDYVRVESPSTLVVGVTAGPSSWTRVSGVSTSSNAISIGVRTLPRPGPGTALGVPVELRIDLEAPLGARQVIDASDGAVVTETDCPLPVVFGPGCVVARGL